MLCIYMCVCGCVSIGFLRMLREKLGESYMLVKWVGCCCCCVMLCAYEFRRWPFMLMSGLLFVCLFICYWYTNTKYVFLIGESLNCNKKLSTWRAYNLSSILTYMFAVVGVWVWSWVYAYPNMNRICSECLVIIILWTKCLHTVHCAEHTRDYLWDVSWRGHTFVCVIKLSLRY